VHPDLVRVVKRAISISDIDFTVIEGLRTPTRQKELFAKGATKTMRSRHIHGFAVDIAPYVAGSIRWDWPLFDKIEEAMKKAAHLENVSITWGGDWKSFKDGPHWELPHAKYPDPK
jgi:peptidoglycan L-alanyl-D-glutamate endopeptidase CwlK